jgi:hypothetical protein
VPSTCLYLLVEVMDMTNTNREALTQGQMVRDGLGHWYQVIEVQSPYRYRVQPFTPCGTGLAPIGTPVSVGRSEMRADGE